jgi:multiple antibiotic resistance protein
MLNFALTALVSILFVVDPLGVVPAYLVLTSNESPAKRERTALKASLIATIVMGAFAALGKTLFGLLGLTLPAFQIAGGLILFMVAIDMLRAERHTQEAPAELDEARTKPEVAITPLAIPMLAGPAALSTVTTLTSQAHDALELTVVYLAIGITGLSIYIVLRMAEPLHRWLGQTGIHVFSRILGLILAAVAVQFVLDGLRDSALIPRGGEAAATAASRVAANQAYSNGVIGRPAGPDLGNGSMRPTE